MSLHTYMYVCICMYAHTSAHVGGFLETDTLFTGLASIHETKHVHIHIYICIHTCTHAAPLGVLLESGCIVHGLGIDEFAFWRSVCLVDT